VIIAQLSTDTRRKTFILYKLTNDSLQKNDRRKNSNCRYCPLIVYHMQYSLLNAKRQIKIINSTVLHKKRMAGGETKTLFWEGTNIIL